MKVTSPLPLCARRIFASLFALVSASAGHALHAQNPGALDPGFTDAGLPADAFVQNILPLATGKIYVTGANILLYTTGGQYSNFIRLNGDGSLDTTFDPSGGGTFQAYPLSLVAQSSGKILIDSVFQVGNRASGSEVARFNTDGTYDPTFSSSPGFSEYQVKMLVQPDDKIILIGSVSYNSVSGSIARLNADGSVDPTLPISQFTDYEGDSSFPQQDLLQPDGKIIVAGRLYSVGGGQRNGVARLNADGTLDPTFDIGDSATPDSNRIISAAALQSDGKILIGGSIDLPGQSFGVARLSSTGVVDTTFSTGTGFSAASGYPAIDSLFVQADGKILVGGIFDHYNGAARNNLARLNTDGSLDTTFDAGAGPSGGDEGGVVLTFASDTVGRLLVGGDFTTFSGAVHNGVARLLGSSTDTALTATTFLVNGSAQPSIVAGGAALTFTATQGAAASSGVYVRVQATATPTDESSWTDLTDTTNGGAGFLKGDGTGNYTLTTTQYPLGTAIYFRVISAAAGQTDSISNVVGPFNLTAADNPTLTATTLLVNGSAQPAIITPGAPLTFTATQGAAASSGVFVRVQATATPTAESSWTDLNDTTNGGAGLLKSDGTGNYTLTTTQYPLGAAIYFRAISAAAGQSDSISNIVGPFSLTTVFSPLTATTFQVNGSIQPFAVAPGAPLTFTATQGAAAGSGVIVRVQATATPNIESSWTDLTDPTNGGAGFLKGDGNGNYALTTAQYPSGRAISFRVISASAGQTDSVSNIIGAFSLTNASTPILTIDQTASTPDDPKATVAITGDLITYTFTVRNSGTAPAKNVKVLNIFPTTLRFVNASIGYIFSSGNTFTSTFPQIAAGGVVTFKVTAAVTSAAPLGSVVNNRGYNVQADGVAAVQGADINSTKIIPPLEITVSSNGSKVVPGQKLTYTIAVKNRTPSQIKGIKLALPLPAASQYVSAGFFNAAGTTAVIPPPSPTGANPELNGGSNLFFYIDALAPKKITYLHLVVQVPVDVDPVGGVVLSGLKVTTATKVGGLTSFTLPDIDIPLSGKGTVAKPQITFSKLPIDAIDLQQSIGAQKAEANKLLAAIKAAAKADPALIAEFIKIYPGLATLTSFSAPVADFAAALDPDVSYDDADAGSSQLTDITVNAPAVNAPTYIAFVLPYANAGANTLSDVVIKDEVPAGTSIFLADNATYNGSVIINGKLGSLTAGGNLEIDNRRTLFFHLGDVAPGAEGFVIYKVRVLAPGEIGAPSVGAVLTTSGSVLSSTNLSHTYIGQPDGRNITVVGPYDYYLESNQVSSNTALLSEPVVYEIYYRNTGSRKSAVLDIDDPIPTGLQYVTTQLFDENHHQLLKAPASAVDVPSDPTNGTLVFHPAKFTPSGTVAPGAGGYIRIYFAPLAVTKNGFVHSPVIPKSSFATKGSSLRGSTTRARTLYGPGTRGTTGNVPENAASMTRVDESGLAKLFIAVAMPMTMVEGAPSEIFLVGGSLNDTAINDVAAGTLSMILPKGVQFEPYNEFGTDYASYQTSQTADGLTELQINFVNGLPAHGAAIAKFVVQPQTGTASKTPVVFPGCTLTLGPSTPFALRTGPINVRVMTTAEAASLSTLQGQVAGAILPTGNLSDPLFKDFISHITADSRTIVVAGASGVSSNNGSVLIQLQGTPGNVLAMGPAGSVGAQGQAKSTLTSDFKFICATGAASDITIGAAPGVQGATQPAQSAQTLLSNVTSAAPGNGVKIGALSLLNGGGSDIISQDGSGLISENGNGVIGENSSGLTGQMSTADLAPSGVSMATGVGNASIISQDGGGLVSSGSGTLSAAGVVSNDGGSLVSTKGGNVLSGSGASGVISNDGGSALPTGEARPGDDPTTRGERWRELDASGGTASGPVQVGTPDQTAVFHATPAGILIQVGSTTGLFQRSTGN